MAKKLRFVLLAMLFLLITLAYPCWSEPITNIKSLGKVPHEVQRVQLPTFHDNPLIPSDGCEQTYGVMPCTNTVLGNGFLILVYIYCIFWAAKILTDGSEILLEILGSGIIGGLSLLIFSSLPNAIIILASGLSETKETAQSQLSIGMGLLAGTAVNLLTLLWGSSVLFSRHDLEESADSTNTKRFSFTGSVVNTDIQTTYAARIMVISVIPIMVVLLPQAFEKTSQSRYALLISVIVSFSLLISYGVYQVIFYPWIQKRKLDYANQKHELSNKHSKSNATRIFYKENGEPDTAAFIKLFKKIDTNDDGYLSPMELKVLLLGINLKRHLDIDAAVESILRDFDASEESRISMDRFLIHFPKWLDETKPSDMRDNHHSLQNVYLTHHRPKPIRFKHKLHPHRNENQHLLGEQSDLAGKSVGNSKFSHHRPRPIRFKHSFPQSYGNMQVIGNLKWVVCKTILMLLLGILVASFFADPLVDVVDNFAIATRIPSFFISFIILPFAGCSDVVLALFLVSREKPSIVGKLTFSEIYRLVTVNNIIGLSIFLSLIYIRNLEWYFSIEMLTIVIVCIAIGLLASFRTTFPPWMCAVAYTLYPFSLVLVYVLDSVLGLS
ncbi:sodium/calcium exchanger NCL1-like isoform X3 [Quercus lobata]|uniref:sodium/calcium exchanger NCL1-like isoform X3 n=1 Tax=Quercus lobata TaxID=97700 RepID=UPI00124512BE|nr:sodium/calcium exchanger NCL1-like isoform X3 [Quercus lobata]